LQNSYNIYDSDFINFLCNKNFSKIIFCQKSEKDKYLHYKNTNSEIFYCEDINDKNLLNNILHKKYDIIVASKVLTKIENINEFLEIIKKVSDQNSRLIVFNKSFLYLAINSFFSKKKFNWLNTNELKTYLEKY